MSGQSRAIAVGVLVTVLWSPSWLLVRWGDARSLDPVAFAAIRYLLAAATLMAFALARHRRDVATLLRDRGSMRRVIALGVVNYAVTQAAQFVAIVRQPAATTSLVLSATVIVVAVLSRITLREPISRAVTVGAGLVVAGSFVFLRGTLGFTAIGMAASLLALAGNSAATLLGRAVNRESVHRPVVLTAVSMAIGSIALTAFAIAQRRSLPQLDSVTVGIICWMAFVNTAVAFSLWSWVLRHVTAAAASSINNLMLVEIAGLGWVVLDERLGALDIAGIAIVAVGVITTQRMTRPGDRPATTVAPRKASSRRHPVR